MIARSIIVMLVASLPAAGCTDPEMPPDGQLTASSMRDAGSMPDGSATGPLTIAVERKAPFYIAADGSDVYWVDGGPVGTPQNSMILKCPVSGCAGSPTVLAANQNLAWGIALDSSHVYWTNTIGGEVMKCSKSGCGGSPTQLASGQDYPHGIAVDGTRVYWANSGFGAGAIRACALPDCAGGPISIATSQDMPDDVAVDATAVYWTNQGVGVSPNSAGSIARCSNLTAGCGGSPEILFTVPSAFPRAIAVDSSDVYWLDFATSFTSGKLLKCGKTGCSNFPTTVAQGLRGPYDLAVDGQFVYWTNNFPTDTSTGEIGDAVFKCPVTGCTASPTILARDQGAPRGIAIDTTAVYFTSFNQQAVLKVSK